MRESFVFYKVYRDVIQSIKDGFGEKVALQFYEAIVNYGLHGIEPSFKKKYQPIWHIIKHYIDLSIKHKHPSTLEELFDKEYGGEFEIWMEVLQDTPPKWGQGGGCQGGYHTPTDTPSDTPCQGGEK